MNEQTISVVIPTYNRSGQLQEAVESALAQTRPPMEILIVDDGSKDDTPEVARAFGEPVRYLRQENRGPSAARNNGILHARGEWIAFLDSDDAWLPQRLEKQMEVISRDPGLGIVASAYYWWMPDEGRTVLNREEGVGESGGLVEKIFVKNFFGTSTVLARRECFSAVGGFNENMRFAEDWDMWLRIISTFRAAYLDTPLAKMRKQSESITGSEGEENFAAWAHILRSYENHPLVGPFTLRKARSWFHFNYSYHYSLKGDKQKERRHLARSLAEWPFFYPKRFTALARTYCSDETYFRLRRKLLGR